MSLKNKVIWSEGMFLQPHHLQQQDRYWENLINNRPTSFGSYGWGITEITLDPHLLALGKIAIASCRGILPDGTLIDIPAIDEAPSPIEAPEGVSNSSVFLALPLRRHGIAETGQSNNDNYRYKIASYEVTDSNDGSENITQVQIGKLCTRLLLEENERSNYSYLAIAKICEKLPDHAVVLDEQFLAPCLDIHALPLLHNFIHELVGLLHHRAEVLAKRITETGQGHHIAEIADFMLLQLINRFEPIINHFANTKNLHPQSLFIVLLQLTGELATFTNDKRRPITTPVYKHDNLQQTFSTIFIELRRALSTVLEQTAISLPIEKRDHGIWVTPLIDQSLLLTAHFVLAVTADLPIEILRQQIPIYIKIAPVEQIRTLITRALPGIDLQPLAVAPRQIPFHANFVYFSFNQHHNYWKQLEQAGGMAFHISGNFPGIILNLWAIRG